MVDDFAGHLGRHVLLAGSGFAGGALLGTAVGYAAFAQARLRGALLGALVALRTVPSLAILMLAVPLLGIGVRPAIAALIILAAVPIAISVEASLRGVSPELIEAAQALGLSAGRISRSIRRPLAMPVALAGFRTAAVETLAGASLAAFIGGGGFGDYILEGLANGDTVLLGVGAATIALCALVSEALLHALQRAIRTAQ